MPVGQQVDPFRAYNFKLYFKGEAWAQFTEVSGLNVRVDVIRYREGGSRAVRCIPGQLYYGDVTFRYGLTSSPQLWNWFQGSVRGEVERLNVTIGLLDAAASDEVMRWNLNAAWIAEWSGAVLSAKSRELAIESMTLVYDELNRE